MCDREGLYDSKGKKPYMDLTKQRAPTAHLAHRIASLDPAAREAIIKYAVLGMSTT